ncbi:hypothetical protein RhiirA1_452265 [Rhizophagus irregularis]|uniref:Uncharacterized protein n=1 Tax=Rhizophagus irregularis TaxID=588596 RepID=A0A2N0SAA5_9GLOM|nr:hypothetical protein RhiirA1_452265 [Rhizophagus irregularis]
MSLIKFNENIPLMAINNHYTASINARIEIFVVEVQSILDKINNIEQIVNVLYEEKRWCEEARIVNQSETAQGQNETESINSSVNSSSNVSSEGISCNIWARFKRITDRIMSEKKLTLDGVCNRIAIEISDYGIGKICT